MNLNSEVYMKKFLIVFIIFAFPLNVLIFSQNLNKRTSSEKETKIITQVKPNAINNNLVIKGVGTCNIPRSDNALAGPNLVPFTPSAVVGFGWDYPIIASNFTGANKDVYPIWDCRDVYLSFAVINNGTTSVLTKFYVKVYVDGYEYYSDFYDKELIANNFVYWRDVNIGKLWKGQHIISISADVTNTVVESNESDNVYSRYKTVYADTLPPVITHTPPISATVYQPINITASAYDYETSVVNFYLLYRMSGDLWDNTLFSNFTNGSATIPASYVTNKGVDYKIVASDEDYNYENYYSTNDNYSNYYSIPVTVPNTSITAKKTTGGSEFTSYKLFSLPFDFGTVLANNIFSGAGEFKKGWRLRYLAGTNTFADAETQSLEVNKAYFLITRNDYSILPSGSGKTSRLNYYDYVGVPVKAGWNLIGNPFSFRVATTKLRVINPVTYDLSKMPDAYEYDGKSGWVKADYLNAWEGLAVYSDFDTKLQFWLGYENIGKISEKYTNKNLNWVSKIIVSNGDTQDEENYFGMQDKALEGKDNLDAPEPPVIEDGVTAYFPHPEWKAAVNNFSEDIRPVNVSGGEWPVVIKSGSSKPITISFSGLENIPVQNKKYLFDDVSKLIYDLSTTSSITIPGFIGEKNYKILIGDNSFVKEKSNVDLVPSKIALSQNYPNPFNPTTSIRFSLTEDSYAKIILYDTYGRQVKTITSGNYKAGYHDVIVNASDLSSGVYYYKLDVNGTSSFSDVKKMILLK